MSAMFLARGLRGLTACVVVTTLGLVNLALAGATAPAAPRPQTAPLETVVSTSAGTWAILAMGDLSQPANRFFELLFLANGDTRWSLVTPPGFATNGGIVALAHGDQFLAGLGASNYIAFSPLARSSDNGRSWSPAILDRPLRAVPDALSALGARSVAALIGDPANSVEVASAGLQNWKRAVGANALARAAVARACAPQAITAVAASPAGSLLVGAQCSHPGVVGIYAKTAQSWAHVGPTPSAASVTAVLRLREEPTGVAALLSTRSGGTAGLAGSWWDGRGSWQEPVRESLASGEQLVSSTIGADGSIAVLCSKGGRLSASLLAHGARRWRVLPPPPKDSQALALEPSGAIDALAVSHASFRNYRLEAATKRWRQTQVLDVPIKYGSSA